MANFPFRMIAAVLCAAVLIAGNRSTQGEHFEPEPIGGAVCGLNAGDEAPADFTVVHASGVTVEPVIQLGHTGTVHTFQFSPDGKWLLTAGTDGQVIQWDAITGDLVRSFAVTGDLIRSYAGPGFELAPDGRSVLMILGRGAAFDDRLPAAEAPAVPSLVSLQTGQVLQQVREGPAVGRFHAASLATDGRYMLLLGPARSGDYSLPARCWLWDVHARQMVWKPGMPLPFAVSDKARLTPEEEGRQRVLFYRSVRPDGRILAAQTPFEGDLFAPDGRRMLTQYGDDISFPTGVTLLWDIASAEVLATFSDVRRIQYSPDGKRFVRGIGSETAEIHETATGKRLLQLAPRAGRITALAYSPDGATILSGSQHGSIRLFDAANGQVLREWSTRKAISSVAFSSDAKRALVVAPEVGTVLYDARSGQEIRRFGAPLLSCSWGCPGAFSPDDRRILALGQGPHASQYLADLWDAEMGKLVRRLRVTALNPIALSPDGRWAIGSGRWLWDVAGVRKVHRFKALDGRYRPDWPVTSSGERLQGWRYAAGSPELRIAFPREVREALSSIEGLPAETKGWLEGFILPESDRWAQTLNPYPSSIPSRRAGRIARRTRGAADTMNIYDVEQDVKLRELAPSYYAITSSALSPDGTQLLIGGRSERDRPRAVASLWDVDSGEPLWRVHGVFGERGSEVRHAAFSPDGRCIALGTAADQRAVVAVVDARNGDELFATNGRPVFGPDGKRAVFLGNSHTLWDLESATMLHDFGRHSPIRWLVFSPSGRSIWINLSGRNGLYSAATGELLHETGEPFTGRLNPTFALDGSRFASRHFGHPSRPGALWDFENARKLTDLVDPDGRWITSTMLTPDGRRLIGAIWQDAASERPAADSSAPLRAPKQHFWLIVWDTETGAMLSRHLASAPVDPVADLVYWSRLIFTPDGDHCLTLHACSVILWEIESGRPLHVFRENGARRLEAVISPDGQSLLTAVPNDGATLWDLATGEKVRAFPRIPILAGGRSAVFWNRELQFSQDGQRIISRTHHGRGIHQVCVQTGRLIGGFYLLGDDDAVAYTPDGHITSTSPELVRYRRPGTNILLD